MTKCFYSLESLTRALEIIQRVENWDNANPNSEMYAFRSLSLAMDSLKISLEKMSCSLEKQETIEVFKVLTEISFNKLEKDVMGVN